MIDTVSFRWKGKRPFDHADETTQRVFVDHAKNKVLHRAYETYQRDTFRAQYLPDDRRATIEFSLPKFVFGSNSKNWININQSVHILNNYMSRQHQRQYYHARRVDIGFNVVYSDQAEADYIISAFKTAKPKRAHYAKLDHTTKSYQHSVFYPTRDYSVKVYNKGWEQKDQSLRNVLRFEATLRTQKLRTFAAGDYSYKPYYGVRFQDINLNAAHDWFIQFISDWVKRFGVKTGYKSYGAKGVYKLMQKLDELGKLDETLDGANVPYYTVSRYRKQSDNGWHLDDVIKNITFEPSNVVNQKLQLFYHSLKR